MNSIDPTRRVLVDALKEASHALSQPDLDPEDQWAAFQRCNAALHAASQPPIEIAGKDKAWWLQLAVDLPSMKADPIFLIASTMADKPKQEPLDETMRPIISTRTTSPWNDQPGDGF